MGVTQDLFFLPAERFSNGQANLFNGAINAVKTLYVICELSDISKNKSAGWNTCTNKISRKRQAYTAYNGSVVNIYKRAWALPTSVQGVLGRWRWGSRSVVYERGPCGMGP